MNKDWTWSLTELYASFDDPAFKGDMELAKAEIEGMKAFAVENFNDHNNEREKIEGYLTRLLAMEKYYKLSSFASLSLSANSEDAAAQKNGDVLQRMMTELAAPGAAFEKFVAEADLDACAANSALIREHMFYLKEIKAESRYQLSEKEEALISKLRNTGSGAWGKMKEQLAATLSVDVEHEGKTKTMTLSMARNLARDPDAALRKAAYTAELKSYSKIDKAAAAALNAIKGEVITVSGLRGYASPLEMTVKQSRMEMGALDAMLSAMKDFLPVFHTYYKKKAKRLGHTKGLPWHDILAPTGSVSMTFTIDEAADFVVKNFTDFSPRLGEFARKAFDSRWIDVFPRPGKRGGAFCSGLPQLRQCRILTNFDGSFDAMLTLAHELGHGYHGYCLKETSYLNTRYPMPLAETASTFCETLVARAALKTATKDEATVIRENDIGGNAQVIVDIYSRFLFEDELFRRRVNGPLTVDELNALMTDCQKAAYGDGLDHDYLNPGMWINKTHYYYAGRNYYNFPYAYGQLFALGLYARYLEQGQDFIPQYDAMLAQTGMNDLAGVGRMMDIDVSSKDFWVSSLKIIEKEIEEYTRG